MSSNWALLLEISGVTSGNIFTCMPKKKQPLSCLLPASKLPLSPDISAFSQSLVWVSTWAPNQSCVQSLQLVHMWAPLRTRIQELVIKAMGSIFLVLLFKPSTWDLTFYYSNICIRFQQYYKQTHMKQHSQEQMTLNLVTTGIPTLHCPTHARTPLCKEVGSIAQLRSKTP